MATINEIDKHCIDFQESVRTALADLTDTEKLKVTESNFDHFNELLPEIENVMTQIERELRNANRQELLVGATFKRVGSSQDGTRPGNLNKVDYLLELALTHGEIELYECGTKQEFKVAYPVDVDVNPKQLNQTFRDVVNDMFLQDKITLRSGLCHSGFGTPNFSGIRRNGPATTLLFKWKGELVSVDMTPALPLPQHKEKEIKESIKKRLEQIRTANPGTSFYLHTKVHIVPKAPEEVHWQLSTSLLKTEVIKQLHATAAVKRMIKEVPSSIKAKPDSEQHDANTDGLIQLWQFYNSHSTANEELERRKEIIKVMQYAHIFLPSEVAKENGELVKSLSPIRSFATKHASLNMCAANPDFYKPTSDEQCSKEHWLEYADIATSQCRTIVDRLKITMADNHDQRPYLSRKGQEAISGLEEGVDTELSQLDQDNSQHANPQPEIDVDVNEENENIAHYVPILDEQPSSVSGVSGQYSSSCFLEDAMLPQSNILPKQAVSSRKVAKTPKSASEKAQTKSPSNEEILAMEEQKIDLLKEIVLISKENLQVNREILNILR